MMGLLPGKGGERILTTHLVVLTQYLIHS